MNGLQHISSAFNVLAEGSPGVHAVLHTWLSHQSDSVQVVSAIARAGADLVELGIPFSIRWQIGPHIQHSTQVALEAG